MKIVRDGMGGDYAPAETVKGAVEAAALINHDIYIVGKKQEIEEELKKNKFVKKFRLGQYGEGEDGVTIAEFG